MARSVRFATRAAKNRAALPPAIRRLVTDRIVALAEDPDPAAGDDIRLVAPAGPSSGLVMTFVLHGRYFVIIIYRIMADDELWIPWLERVYTDTPPAAAPNYELWP